MSEKIENLNKFNRYMLQSAVRKILPDSRTAKCLRKIHLERKQPLYDAIVKVHKSINHDSAFFSGLEVCGSIWTCPICAAKISEKRREELTRVIEEHKANGGELIMITRTVPHYYQSLKEFLNLFLKAEKTLKESNDYRKLKSKVGLIGTIRVLEITHGENGWHVHSHELWFLERDFPTLYGELTGLSFDEIERRYSVVNKRGLFNIWLESAKKHGFANPSPYAFDVRNGDFAKNYITKWGKESESFKWTADYELTKSHLKNSKSKKGKTPFDLLKDFFLYADKKAALLFKEFAECFKGKHQLQWSKGLKKKFLVREISDEELAKEIEDKADIIGSFSVSTWEDIILKNDIRHKILELALNAKWNDINNFVQNIRKRQCLTQ